MKFSKTGRAVIPGGVRAETGDAVILLRLFLVFLKLMAGPYQFWYHIRQFQNRRDNHKDTGREGPFSQNSINKSEHEKRGEIVRFFFF